MVDPLSPGKITPAFSLDEYRARLARVQAVLRAGGDDVLLLFMPESVTWLTGFYTRAYGSFQFVIVPAEGEPTIICRDVEQYYLERTAVFGRHVLWCDSDDPFTVGVKAIRNVVGAKPRLSVELSAWTLNAARYQALTEAFPESPVIDASGLVAGCRLIKSPAEIDYQRRAASAAECGMRAAIETAREGASERDMAAAICGAMILGGSDNPGPGILSSGEGAFYLHGAYGDRVLSAADIVQIEVTPCVRQYHARFMRPIMVAEARDEDYRTVEQLIAIQDRALAAVAPGVEARVPDAIYRDGVLSAGLATRYTNKSFYSIGMMFPPNSGEPLEATPESSWRFAPGMVLHSYVLARGFGMSETIAINETGYEQLTCFPRRLFVGG